MSHGDVAKAATILLNGERISIISAMRDNAQIFLLKKISK